MAGIKRAKGSKGKCDKLVREILLLNYNSCLKCGSRDWLQTSHIISRRYSNTRCDMDNVQLLCAKCHRRFTDFPREFSHWITESIGSDKYEQLRSKAESIGQKMNWDLELDRLKKIKNDCKSN